MDFISDRRTVKTISNFVVCIIVDNLAVDVMRPVADEEVGIKVQTGRAVHDPFVAVCA